MKLSYFWFISRSDRYM